MNKSSNKIVNIVNNNIHTINGILKNKVLINSINKACEQIIYCYNNKGKLLLCGNGGSAADAQHIAAELSGRFYYDRLPLAAEAIHVNTSYITSVANDYSFDKVYSRYVKAFANPGDIVIGISTSGNSINIVNALNQAKKNKALTIALTGKTGGKLKNIADILINVPSEDTPRIQESHILIGHIICEIVENTLFPKH